MNIPSPHERERRLQVSIQAIIKTYFPMTCPFCHQPNLTTIAFVPSTLDMMCVPCAQQHPLPWQLIKS